MARQIANEYKCNSADEFIQNILLISVQDGPSWSGLYRGFGDAAYALIPSILRTDTKSEGRLRGYACMAGEDFAKISDADTLRRVELTILADFYSYADRAGLALPNIEPHLHEAMVLYGVRLD